MFKLLYDFLWTFCLCALDSFSAPYFPIGGWTVETADTNATLHVYSVDLNSKTLHFFLGPNFRTIKASCLCHLHECERLLQSRCALNLSKWLFFHKNLDLIFGGIKTEKNKTSMCPACERKAAASVILSIYFPLSSSFSVSFPHFRIPN